MSDVSRIKEIELFRNIDEKVLKSLAPVLEERQFGNGQIIFNEDDKGDEIYFIFSGEVEIVKLVNKEENASQLLSLLGKGEFFGEMALFDKKRRSATAKAKGDTVVCKLSCKDFYYFMKNDAQIAISILGGMLSETIKRLRETDIGFVTVYETGMLLASEQKMDRLLDGVLNKIMKIMTNSERGLIALYNEFSEKFEIQAQKGFPDKNIILKDNDAVIDWLKEHKERLIVANPPATFLFNQRSLPGYYGSSFIMQPFMHRNELLGFLLISNTSSSINVVRNQMNLLSGIASQIAPVIANAKKVTEEENRKRLKQTKMPGS